MRIAFYAPLKPPTHAVPSGDRRMARLFLRALAAGGHEVDLASVFRVRDGRGDPARQQRLKALGFGLARRLVRRYLTTPALTPDLWFTYHVYYKAPDWIGPQVAQALNIPYVVAEASYAPKRARGPWAQGHAQTAKCLHEADLVLGLNSHDAACVLPKLRAPEIWHPFAPFLDQLPYTKARAERPGHRARLAAEHDLPAETPWLLAVGMMRPGDKLASYRQLGRALELVRDRDWRLLVVGDGDVRAAVEVDLAPLGEDRVRYLGRLEEDALAGVYAACDLMVWPAVNEAYGMALLEAEAAGLPVVAARTGGVPDIVADGATGLLAEPGDIDGLAAHVAALLDDPARRTAYGKAAFARVAERHSIDGAGARLALALERAQRFHAASRPAGLLSGARPLP